MTSTSTGTTRRTPSGTTERGRKGRRRATRWVAALTLAASLVAVDVLRGEGGAAFAADYPTWEDVLAAKGSEEAKNAEVANIRALIDTAQAELQAAEEFAILKADEYSAAQDAYDTAVFRADELAAQAAEATARAEASNKQAGMLVSQFTRTGGGDLSLNLFVSGEDSDDLLYQLGAMSRLSETTGKLYERAAQDSNTAASLTEQADIAEGELEALKVTAQEAFDAAVAAQAAAEDLLAEQEAQRVVLDAQLAALQSATAQTVAEYEKGVEERRKAEEAARAAEAARKAAEDAARQEAGGGPPPVSVSGWGAPLSAWRVTSEWGMRFHPIARVNRLHAGIDLVQAGGGTCGAPVYAAAAGTVIQSGYNGGLGYSVTINHGGGLTTVYGHNSSLVVGYGQDVGGGELIAYAGTTGSSTGCHVHFETRVNGTSQNPRNYVGF
ncbi:M23 family metallopeptidase [Herbiconiux liukaitaii]|uniref:M23 family metallopeptidase n=1 Tax=Herbiconiux liukaitaii TaxID=3342799 RepID=UPI0035B8B586